MTSLKNDNTLVEILLKDLGCRIHRLLSAIHLFHAVLSAVSAILEMEMLFPAVVFIKSLAQMPVCCMENFH